MQQRKTSLYRAISHSLLVVLLCGGVAISRPALSLVIPTGFNEFSGLGFGSGRTIPNVNLNRTFSKSIDVRDTSTTLGLDFFVQGPVEWDAFVTYDWSFSVPSFVYPGQTFYLNPTFTITDVTYEVNADLNFGTGVFISGNYFGDSSPDVDVSLQQTFNSLVVDVDAPADIPEVALTDPPFNNPVIEFGGFEITLAGLLENFDSFTRNSLFAIDTPVAEVQGGHLVLRSKQRIPNRRI